MRTMLEGLQLYVVDILGRHLVATTVLPADGSFSPSVVPSAFPDPFDGSASDLLLVEEFARRRKIRLGKRSIDEVPDAVIDHGILDNDYIVSVSASLQLLFVFSCALLAVQIVQSGSAASQLAVSLLVSCRCHFSAQVLLIKVQVVGLLWRLLTLGFRIFSSELGL